MASATEPWPITEPLPTQPPGFTTRAVRVQQKDHEYVNLTAEDLRVAGILLIVAVLPCVLMNLYTFYIVGKNWRSFVAYPFFQSNILCMFLSFADLMFALTCGVPTVLHLTFAEFFSSQNPRTMITYARYGSYILVEFFFVLRTVIIVAVCLDRCIHILQPLKYNFFVSKRKTMLLIALCLLLPFLIRIVPNLYGLLHPSTEGTECRHFQMPGDQSAPGYVSAMLHDAVNFTIPMTCRIVFTYDLETEIGRKLEAEVERMVLAEATVMVLFLVAACLAIIISNVLIVSVIVKKFSRRKTMVKDLNNDGSKNNQAMKGVQKNLIATAIMAVSFLASNSPYLVIWIADYLESYTNIILENIVRNDKVRLYMVLSLFLCLIVNPWTYALRMETIRKFFPFLRDSKTRSTRSAGRSTLAVPLASNTTTSRNV